MQRQLIDEVVPQHPGYRQTVTDESIDLACTECRQVCLNPVIASCGHQYCFGCWDDFCDECDPNNGVSQSEDLTAPRHDVLRRTYDRFLVECLGCKKMVQRGFDGRLFEEHAKICLMGCRYCGDRTCRADLLQHYEQCNQVPIRCPANDIGCPFTGPNEPLIVHKKACPLVQIAPMFRELKANNIKLLSEQLEVANGRILELENDNNIKLLSEQLEAANGRILALETQVSKLCGDFKSHQDLVEDFRACLKALQ